MKVWKAIVLGGVLLASTGMVFSLMHPWGDVHSVSPRGQILAGSVVPDDVRGILERKCGDCHSNQTHWPVYSRVAPVSWLVEHDVHAGRSAMNLSLWVGMGTEDRIALLTRLAAEVRSGEMPPKPYATLHAATLSESDKQKIAAWARIERKRIRSETSAQKGIGTQ